MSDDSECGEIKRTCSHHGDDDKTDSSSAEEQRRQVWATPSRICGPVHVATPPAGPNLISDTALTHHHKSAKLYVVCMISNPVQFSRRYKLYMEFERRMLRTRGVALYTVEVAIGNRRFEVTNHNNPRHLQIRTDTELWHKESALDLLVQRLPSDFQYLAWIDCDVEFNNRNWVDETLQQLQIYDVVQLFQTCADLGPSGETLQTHSSFGWLYSQGKPYRSGAGYGKPYWHTGFAWACTRRAWNGFGGLPTYAILGAADHHLALALIGQVRWSFPDVVDKRINKNYKSKLLELERRCERHIKRNIGYVKGTILHFWHGKKKDRKYGERWSILIENDYDPETDIKLNDQGMVTLEDYKPQLRDDIRRYFRARNEDSIDLE
jgi:hypothetical protein